uniref:(northern house mosquito) hypothetical protein n=1 Tax=Culex pipiens TaxID=7175 RepID=A0A8D8FYW5_CULPI
MLLVFSKTFCTIPTHSITIFIDLERSFAKTTFYQLKFKDKTLRSSEKILIAKFCRNFSTTNPLRICTKPSTFFPSQPFTIEASGRRNQPKARKFFHHRALFSFSHK